MSSTSFFQVARYESLVLTRNLLFKLLAISATAGVFFFQYLVQGEKGYSWEMVAFDSSMPIVNAYLYNLVQCFLVLFFAAELPSREKAAGSLEVIHARPVGNGTYFFGKVTGIVTVFAGMNLVVILVCAFINLVVVDIPFNASIYLFYFVTQTLPSLLFMTAFPLWIALVSGSRTLALLLSLVLFYLSASQLPHVLQGTFDILGISLSSVFSSETGFPRLDLYLLQRLFVVSLAITLFLQSARVFKRLPNNPHPPGTLGRYSSLPLLVGLLSLGCYTGYHITESHVREAYRESFSRHWHSHTCDVTRHNITFQQHEEHLTLSSEMVLYNSHTTKLPRIVLFLNPSLVIKDLSIEGNAKTFKRDHQVVLVEHSLAPGDSVHVSLTYEGTIDERYCYLDIPDKEYRKTNQGDVFFHYGHHYALVEPDILLLIPECGWYPVSIPTSNPQAPVLASWNFTHFNLKVITPQQPVTLSQGIYHQEKDTLFFSPPLPLEGLTLCGGNYKRSRLTVEGLNVDFYYFPGHNLISPQIKVLNDQDIKFIVKRRLDCLSTQLAGANWYDYPGGHLLRVIETPLPFTSFSRLATNRSELVQPGIVFIKERGKGIPSSWIMYRLKREKDKDARRDLEESLVEKVISNIILPHTDLFQHNPFLYQLGAYNKKTTGIITSNLSSASCLLENKNTYIYSDTFPEINLILSYVRNQPEQKSFGEIVDNKTIMYLDYLREHGINGFVRDPKLSQQDRSQILHMSATSLFNHLNIETNRDSLFTFFKHFYQRYNNKKILLDTLTEAYNNRFGKDFNLYLRRWSTWNPTLFQIKELNGIEEIDRSTNKIRFQVINNGQDSGLISVIYLSVREDFVQTQLNYLLAPGEAKEIKIIDNNRIVSFYVNTGISRNKPNVFRYQRLHPTINIHYGQTTDTTSGVFSISPALFAPVPGEIIVDNRDQGFTITDAKKTWLQRLRKDPELSEYFQDSFNPNVTHWTKYISAYVHGDSIRDAYYKCHDQGESTAEWKTHLPEAGEYEVFALLHTSAAYYYTIYHGDQSTEISLNTEKIDKWDSPQTQGWRSLGRYYFPRGEALIILDDRGIDNGLEENIIVADAVKWVKIK